MTTAPLQPQPQTASSWPEERDACAIIGMFNTNGRPSHGNVQRSLEGLIKMGHRAGEIAGEGDGCGILTDIPRQLWQESLQQLGLPPTLADSPAFSVGHLLVPQQILASDDQLLTRIQNLIGQRGCRILLQRPGQVRSETLSALARSSEPLFWQLALECPRENRDSILFELAVEIEQTFDVHVASLSNQVTAYKVHGAPELLTLYYPELKRKEFTSANTIGHSRFSTNTLPTVLRAQPFSLLGHNGEINTIERLREEARLLGLPLSRGGSDSQDLNRTLEGLICRHGLSLFEAMEICFPPIFSEVDLLPAQLQPLYSFIRRFFPASAQGPAAIISRWHNECVFSVDAMGLRPLWFGETNKFCFVSSEVAVVPQEDLLSDPKVLAPGEKLALELLPGEGLRLLDQDSLRQCVGQRLGRRVALKRLASQLTDGAASTASPADESRHFGRSRKLQRDNLLDAFAWKRSDLLNLKDILKTGREPIASLGYDGPLAALARSHQNLADYFKEQVAVVTNPAIDHEREKAHFSTRVFLGAKPGWRGRPPLGLTLAAPLLCGGQRTGDTGTYPQEQARRHGLCTLEQLLGHFRTGQRRRYRLLDCALRRDETLPQALQRLCTGALTAAQSGCPLLLLDDSAAFSSGWDFLDPALAVNAIHQALCHETLSDGSALRRQTSLVLRSGALRNLHDLVFHLALGTDALCPYLLWELSAEQPDGLANLLPVLIQGIETVLSTMGTHEIGGYGRFFAAIGLADDLARQFSMANFCGSTAGGLSLTQLEQQLRQRRASARRRKAEPVPVQFRLYPRIWKDVSAVARMEQSYPDLSRRIGEFEREHPLAIRHLLDFRFPGELRIDPDSVDTRVGTHDYPFLFSAMSFGSQSETAFRIYAEAARKLNILCMNGEGGEIPDMLGQYRAHRGQQIASGRFGVHIDLLNSADVLEIKVGQGAKPGEGGHLPGFKVTAKIAAARNASPGVSLISPSNNHDIYSIEDLAQIIEELRTANPRARIGVKVPAVAGIGTIAMGIAKAGADIITISGYDGGTGAARKHAIKFVGLPAEIGVREAHRALACSGLRERVELWADGGARSGRDLVKLMLLGANRVGFGTLPMIVIGCTACRNCHLGTCHVGIACQIENTEEARQKGLKRFVPRVLEHGILYETTFFRALGEEIRLLTAKLGFSRTQDLVGQANLLQQIQCHEQLDLTALLQVEACERQPAPPLRTRQLRRPLNYLTAQLSTLVTDAFDQGDERVRFSDDRIGSCDRAIGTRLAGALCQARQEGRYPHPPQALLHFGRDAIAGNGLGAFNSDGISICVEGGAQDGVGKSARGGRIVILKGETASGQRVGGSVGKGLAYGAQGGLFLVQGNADSRACIRLSGADVVLGARLQTPLSQRRDGLATRANLKGFAFEYMTAGRVVVLGDPGPWICSGMTGGTIYCHTDPALGLTQEALRQRLAWGAQVHFSALDDADVDIVNNLLLEYHRELLHSYQNDEAQQISQIMARSRTAFVKISAGSDPDPQTH
ncbi:glutamate synthase-related protein [Desulfuromonas thiophila]|uniref:Glutamate synthase (Ferredoxin) n=1 Tax=Desulfuromonas thiophila TaxID=57664 RepID=A0A1G6ZIU3_9BACT|nr:glutamate synthase-related protein [Desulfuromonas thiophila]SDE02332.1 glutamate synthase (ferredoxin) [Desulfuromonas thiophila]